MLRTVKNMATTLIIHKDDAENLPEMMTNHAINKVKKQRSKSRMFTKSDLYWEWENGLKKIPSPQPIFRTKKIDTEALRRAFKIMKGKRVCGVDNIDSYSLK